ncbi:MAG: rod shape-determining protein MreD [Bacteroidetes bacterium HGW-Bacteroidetes-12]|nr:MAG: rod shape-determining protein MreD [Bacteroidetes bacterium HGW-Bacteroidetes-12]
MLIDGIKYSFYFLILVLAQGLLLNNIEFSGYINPYIYVLFILILPFNTSKYLVLILAFILGLSIDAFSSTAGMHTSATVFMGFLRNYVLKLIEPCDGYEVSSKPLAEEMGIQWFATYSTILVLSHHLFLFSIESFKFSQFFTTLGRAIISCIFTLLLIFIVQLFNYKKASRR